MKIHQAQNAGRVLISAGRISSHVVVQGFSSKSIWASKVVETIAKVALKIPSVTNSCMAGLVKMLDSKCVALSSEAVVALRALLQQREKEIVCSVFFLVWCLGEGRASCVCGHGHGHGHLILLFLEK